MLRLVSACMVDIVAVYYASSNIKGRLMLAWANGFAIVIELLSLGNRYAVGFGSCSSSCSFGCSHGPTAQSGLTAAPLQKSQPWCSAHSYAHPAWSLQHGAQLQSS